MRNTKTKCDRLLVVRVRKRTERRFKRCKQLARALGVPATGDDVLAVALDLLARNLRFKLGQAGIALPPEDQAAPERTVPTGFAGAPNRGPRVDE